jgi:meso-butanediol dehydrogenase/(S,S)-butanediol dehydrogenase/diacetyl reductase
MKRFEGKIVIVTGAASGIGEATARRFSSEGACVALVDRNETPLANVAKDLPAQFTLAHLADVSDSEAVGAMVTTVVKRFGRLDVLVNNAGVFEGGDPAEITNEQWRKVMATDPDGASLVAGPPCPISRREARSSIRPRYPGPAAIGPPALTTPPRAPS